MRGSLWIEKRAVLRSSLVVGVQFRMLAASVAVGVIAGLLVAHVRLNLGLPGHKALLWLPPILAARLLGRCRIGAAVGSAATGCTTFALGGNLAGGPLGLPLLVIAGIFLDLVIGALENRKTPVWLVVPTVADLPGQTPAPARRFRRPFAVQRLRILVPPVLVRPFRIGRGTDRCGRGMPS